jgi:hypothetical protein
MATLRVKVGRKTTWLASDRLLLVLGSEGAADLAGSTPAGGTVVQTVEPWPNNGQTKGGWGAGRWGSWVAEPRRHGWGLGPLTWRFGQGEWSQGAWGGSMPPRLVIEHVYRPAGACTTLPLGVKLRDVAGNVSDVLETVVEISDPPKGARDLRAVATVNDLEIRLTFTQSPHLI